MRVGITYDLKSDYLKLGFSEEASAEFDKIETIEAIDNVLQSMGFETEKIGHIKNLTGLLVQGKRWVFVFNICEGVSGIGREAQVPALLDAYNIPYVFSDPMVLSLTLHKAMAKRVIRDAGVPTPDFAVAYTLDDLKEIHLPFPLFVKPLAEGTGKGINQHSVIRNHEELKKSCENILQSFHQPALIETFLSGREFTVGIVGTGNEAKSVGVMEIQLTQQAEKEVYSYENKSDYYERVKYFVPEAEMVKKCEEIALKAWKVLECRDGGRIDLRCDDKGIPNFIEVNPLAGLNPIDSDLPILARLNGVSYDELLKQIIQSALKRFHL
ncbi:MAG: ATP-grasp domain-containing protein [Bacteroidales bacterium]|nr:ATP-grasp domain-containing protein [Bacteroidales bacterium]